MKKFVRVIIKNTNGDFLIVDQLNGGANFPGGKIEENESIEEAAIREVFEETGLTIKSLELVHNNLFKLGKDDWDGYFLIAKDYEGKPTNKEPKKIKMVDFKNKDWINQHASQVFVINILKDLDLKNTAISKRKI